MKDTELISFQIISTAGSAKSNYIESMMLAKAGKFEEAEKLIKEGKEIFVQGHQAHAKLIQLSAQETLEVSLLLVHAEDQLMNCESMEIFALELLDIYKTNFKLKEQIERMVN
ncbi:MAG: PTS lactose/cellobiose transporter subunit IIA [Erysipelotrichaceae bacterium]|nr:PTS lactose/cellobiose transporter subunit IIA [Erysipelotrichaceae bacterium]